MLLWQIFFILPASIFLSSFILLFLFFFSLFFLCFLFLDTLTYLLLWAAYKSLRLYFGPCEGPIYVLINKAHLAIGKTPNPVFIFSAAPSSSSQTHLGFLFPTPASMADASGSRLNLGTPVEKRGCGRLMAQWWWYEKAWMCVVNDRPVGKPQEQGVMNIAASFSLSKKPR
jgi:hypothetical protein